MTKEATVTFLSGVGGVGKTRVIEEIERIEPEVKVMPSITRSVYKKMGIPEEKTAMALTSEERLTFQSLIFDTYLEETVNFVRDSLEKGCKHIVIDRSPFDHVAYKTYIVPDMTYPQVQEIYLKAVDLFDRLEHYPSDQFGHTMECYVCLFPYPTPWMQEGEDGGCYDDIRHAPAAKNLSWHALLERFLVKSGVTFGHIGASTVKGRAYEILSRIHR